MPAKIDIEGLKKAASSLPKDHPARGIIEQEIADFEEAQPVKGFLIRCEKCGGDNIMLNNTMVHYSEETGWGGSLDLVCRACGATGEVIDHP